MNCHSLGDKSIQKLKGVHPILIICVNNALKRCAVDFTVLEGKRTVKRQEKLFAEGVSKTLKSYHIKGLAVDLAPLPIDWDDLDKFKLVAKAMKEEAKKLGIRITWGGDWKSFVDMPHFQLEIK